MNNNGYGQHGGGGTFEPLAPPPSSAPPIPPDAGESSSLLSNQYGTYQQQQGHRAASEPVITNYYDKPPPAHYRFNYFGDATLEPNTGEDNWIEGEIMGLALHELIKYMQWSLIISCAAAIVLEILFGVFRLFNPPMLVMGCYLAFFSSLLLRVEIALIIQQYRAARQQNAESHSLTAADVGGLADPNERPPDVKADNLADNFGLLFHPLGKAFLLALMGSMCFAHFNIFENIMGTVFFINSFVLLYLYCRYPGFRRRHDLRPIPAASNHSKFLTVRPNTWSYYENNASSLWKVTTALAEHTAAMTAQQNSI